MANGCRTFFRVILGILTGLFLLIGLLMLGFGIALKVDPNGVFDAITKVFSSSGQVVNDLKTTLNGVTDGFGIFMIVVGSVVTVISFIGFAGAISGSTCLLVIYTIVLFLLIGAEIALIVLVAVTPQKLSGTFAPLTNLTKQDVGFTTGNSVAPPYDSIGRAWYFLQNSFDCCGVFGYTDYTGSNVVSRKPNITTGSSTAPNDLQVPTSCCTKKQPGVPMFNSTTDLVDFGKCENLQTSFINIGGCVQKMGVIPIAIAAVTIGLEVLLIICSIVVMALRSREKVL